MQPHGEVFNIMRSLMLITCAIHTNSRWQQGFDSLENMNCDTWNGIRFIVQELLNWWWLQLFEILFGGCQGAPNYFTKDLNNCTLNRKRIHPWEKSTNSITHAMMEKSAHRKLHVRTKAPVRHNIHKRNWSCYMGRDNTTYWSKIISLCCGVKACLESRNFTGLQHFHWKDVTNLLKWVDLSDFIVLFQDKAMSWSIIYWSFMFAFSRQ